MSGLGRATVRLLPEAQQGPVHPQGPVGSVQEAELSIDADLLESLWKPAYLDRLARSYWVYLRRASLGLLRVAYGPGSRSIVLLIPPLVLLRFRAPRYDTGPGFGQVTWPIERGLLASAPGRGHLRIAVRRLETEGGPRVLVRAEVENFYPLLRGHGRFAWLGARIYSLTQLRVHRALTKGFLRSLAALDLPPSTMRGVAGEPG
jgi:hypothetical protein